MIKWNKMRIEYKRYRFDFTDNAKHLLVDFANRNKNAKRKEFLEAWVKWSSEEEIKGKLDQERARMESEGFTGDVLDKMFKSVRYYHKKRPNCSDEEEVKEAPRGGHNNRFSREFLNEMDNYIQKQIENTKNLHKEKDKWVNTLSQAVAYSEYCKANQKSILAEFVLIKAKRGEVTNKMVDTLKKTYKNRFYLCRKGLDKV